MEAARVVVERADADLSAERRELHGIVDQVPKYLLKPDTISQYVMLFGVQVARKL